MLESEIAHAMIIHFCKPFLMSLDFVKTLLDTARTLQMTASGNHVHCSYLLRAHCNAGIIVFKVLKL